jgi:hypothetical protein
MARALEAVRYWTLYHDEKYPNEFIRLTTWFQANAKAPAENVVNGVKTIMVNDPLRTAARVASSIGPC